MKVYVSKRNENVTAKIIKEDEKFKTVVIEYLTGDKAGQNNSITTSTLKRWWKETEVEDSQVEEELTVEDEMKQVELELLADEDETDANLELLAGGDSVEQVETPIIEHKLVPMPGVEMLAELKAEYTKEKVKKPRKVRTPKIDRTKDILEIDDFIGNTYNNKYYESVKCYKIIKEGKTVAEVYPRRKEIEVRVKTVREDFDSDIRYKDGYKYYLPVHYFLDYTSDYIKLITDLIQ